jgi:hypothetical protein
MVTLDTKQITFLIDLMMDADPNLVTKLAKRNQTDDVNVMYQLDNCLHSALEELASPYNYKVINGAPPHVGRNPRHAR